MSPQHETAPALFKAQVWSLPALTAVNAPEGALLTWLLVLLPQHEIAPALFSAQVWLPPALTAVNAPEGASLTWFVAVAPPA